MSMFSKLVGLGLLAGAAVFAASALRRKAEGMDEDVWDITLGEFPQEDIVPEMAEPAEKSELVYPSMNNFAPNVNPVDAPAAPKDGVLDPTKIACAEDFQNWDELGCQS